MADDIGGVWRTKGGRKVFIADGDDLETAMKKSGKFDKNEQLSEEDKNIIDNWVQLGNDIDKEMQDKLEGIIKNNATVTGKCNLIRRVTTPELDTTLDEIKHNPDKLIGKVITSKGFLSTSSKEGGADNFVGIVISLSTILAIF